MKLPEEDSVLGIILTCLSIGILMTLGLGAIVFTVWAAIVVKSTLMQAVLLMVALALPIMWLNRES